jgi:hypothetical protein
VDDETSHRSDARSIKSPQHAGSWATSVSF